MRLARIHAVLRRELVRAGAGRRGLSFAGVALALLLPVGALRLPSPSPSALPVVAGEVAPALRERVQVQATAPVQVRGEGPVQVTARALPAAHRAALEALEPRPAVRLELPPARPVQLPGRALLVALLAISLLTGPLAETLPGEREAGTLEVLLSTSLSRGELVVGKWLAWTGLSALAALLSAAGGVATGALALGPGLSGIPLGLGVAVALGLWLVRGAGDLVGGAAAPMRVLPVAAVGTAGLAWGLAGSAPLWAAAVPLGGALLVAGGVLTGAGPLAAAALGSGAATAALLAATARSLDQQGVKPVDRRAGPWGGLLFGAVAWGLAVLGPAVFALGGDAALLAPPGASLAAGGLLLGLSAAVLLAREARAPGWGGARGLAWGAAVGLCLALADGAVAPLAGPAWAAPFRERLDLALRPAAAGPLVALALAVGQELYFRGWLQRHLGLWGAAVAWLALACPLDPARGALTGLALGLLVGRHGLAAAVLAHALWAVLAGALPVALPARLALALAALLAGVGGIRGRGGGPGASSR